MSLIDKTYFKRDINIPTGTYDDILESLTRYEPEILEQLLGYGLAKLVLAYANPGSDQRIIDIVEGKEYTEGDYTVKWNGLKNTAKVSILAYYTYIQYVKDHSNDFQNVGAAAAVVENGIIIPPAVLIQRASVKLSELAGYPYQDTYAGSLYNFLKKHSTDYPEWIFNEFHPMNILGI